MMSASDPLAVTAEFKPSQASPRGIEYLRSLKVIFEHPEWLKGAILLAVLSLIPVLQTPLIFGYMFHVTEHLHRGGGGPYPLFEIRRFAEYITRGIWCYLIANIVAVILIPVFQVTVQGGMFGSMAAIQSGTDAGMLAVAIGVPTVLLGLLVFLLGLFVVLTPFFLRAGLTQDFALTFNFRWIGDYLRRTWIETTLVNLFLILVSPVLMSAGCALFCVGMFLVGALLTVTHAHLNWQLYELYLARGGEPIPLKPLPAEVPPVISPPRTQA
jgi:hypothetical protein